MHYTQLSSSEIQDLISRYNSELKKLQFQTEEVKNTIQQLEDLLKTVASHEKAALTRMSEQRKKEKTAAVSTGKKRRGRPPKSKVAPAKISPSSTKEEVSEKKGYKLSDWDKLVISSIENKGRVAITQEIIDQILDSQKADGSTPNVEEVKKKVTRSLQKLVNRRGDLAKVAYPGKGFAYALPAWLKGKNVAAQYKFKPSKKG